MVTYKKGYTPRTSLLVVICRTKTRFRGCSVSTRVACKIGFGSLLWKEEVLQRASARQNSNLTSYSSYSRNVDPSYFTWKSWEIVWNETHSEHDDCTCPPNHHSFRQTGRFLSSGEISSSVISVDQILSGQIFFSRIPTRIFKRGISCVDDWYNGLLGLLYYLYDGRSTGSALVVIHTTMSF